MHCRGKDADCVAALSSDARIPDICSAPHPSRALSPTQNLLRVCGCGKAEVLSPRLFLHEKTRCKHASRFLWRRHPDLNWGMRVLHTSALPAQFFSAADCVAALSSYALIPDVCSAPHPSRALSPTQNLLRFCGCGKAEVLSPRLFLHEKTRCKHASRFLWRRHPDLNWGIKVLQTSALPLGYVAITLAG